MIIRSNMEFVDCHTNEAHRVGDEFEVSWERYQELQFNGIDVTPLFIAYRGKKKKSGPKVIVYQKLLYRIGGIETWDYNLAKKFEDRDITFVFTSADRTQFENLSQYANVLMDDGKKLTPRHYDCDVFINANYDGSRDLLDRVTAKKIYQTIHSDFAALKRVNGWTNFTLDIDKRTSRIFSASETAQKGLKEGFGYDSTVLRNILAPLDSERPMVFISLTRASEEKGIGRCIEMAKRFRKEGKKFIWLLCSTLEAGDYDSNRQRIQAIRSIPEFIIVEPQLYSRELLWFADYLVQLSDTEAYCYSIREAMQRGVPVITTPFNEAVKIVKPGENGWIVDFDLHDLNVDSIFNKKPQQVTYSEKVSPLWDEVLGGTA